MPSCTWDDLQIDARTPILDSLGASLAAACAASSSWARAAYAGDGRAFKPLCWVACSAAPGDWREQSARQAEVAKQRRSSFQNSDWRALARVATDPTSVESSWWRVRYEDAMDKAARPSHRHSAAVCGAPAPGCDRDAALIFGGNVSHSVAGHWRTTDELLLMTLPGSVCGDCTVKSLRGHPTAEWPASRWGASLTTLQESRYLFGGWSHEGDTSKLWTLNFREAAVQWCEESNPSAPPSTAFHTVTALDDGKRFAFLGGLGNGGSTSGLWIYASDSGTWESVSSSGPSCAGHAAGCVGNRLAFFGGVQRGRRAFSDKFSENTALFDVRAGRWDQDTKIQDGPKSRRNPTYVTLGRHLLVSGGWDDSSSRSLNDTWALDVSRGVWKPLLQVAGDAPAMEGHKAVVSGMDVFTFGGHNQPGHYSSRTMAVNCLSLGLRHDSLDRAVDAVTSTEESSAESDTEEAAEADRLLELRTLRLLMASVLQRRQAAGGDADSDDEDAEDAIAGEE
eukprot:TRINITY_DN29853_c0_g1_i1.p1 TRINITY_DN29853_c0_g1~~TRINITY_DN29853_c0_g1_i1.p1  ORF type:complete len:508 (-),score=84.58 TRINITY_DN29853_c0_g1_i1:257-1780(-)